MRPRRLLLVVILFTVLPWWVARVPAQTADDLFDASVLQELHLFVHSADLRQLREHADENTYYPADLDWRGMRVRNVAIRSRGLGSRNAIKIGLRLDMDRYVSGRRFLGQRALVLKNYWQDPSLMREPLVMAMFARMGVPAPRGTYARVFMNGEYQGLYSVIEEIGEPYLHRLFGRDDGYLFEHHWLGPWYGDFLGEEPAAYVPLLEPRTREVEPLDALYGPIRELTRLATYPEGSVDWLGDVQRLVDVPQLLAYLAVEAVVSQNDGLLGFAGMTNFYLYRPADTTRHVFLPWDQDNAFDSAESSIWQRVDENPLVRQLLALPDVRAEYLDAVERCVGLLVQDDWLANEVERALAVIDVAAREDVRKRYGEEERRAAVESIRAFARERAARVLAEVAVARGTEARP